MKIPQIVIDENCVGRVARVLRLPSKSSRLSPSMESSMLLQLCLLSLSQRVPSRKGDIGEMKFDLAEFWVQIHQVPLRCMTQEISRFLGSMVGDVIDVDVSDYGEGSGDFIRVRVKAICGLGDGGSSVRPISKGKLKHKSDDNEKEKKSNEETETLLEKIIASGKACMTHAIVGGMYVIRVVIGVSLIEEKHVVGTWKHASSGPSNGKRFESEANGNVMGKNFQERSGAKAKNLNLSNPHTASTSSGSRFDILSEKMDVTMAESGGQVSIKTLAGVKNKEKVVLIVITNQNSSQSNADPRTFSHNKKKFFKKREETSSSFKPARRQSERS
ncbi:hypothetical protein QYF36_015266 [Acer negundo]|nr:hypothetical protein QYF36_015266 [Acer negundo]